MIELRHISKTYETVTPLRDVSAVIRDGEVISVIGPSGTGKSTLIRCINLLDPPTDGEIYLDGELITGKKRDTANVRRKIGMVFQSFNLFDHMTVIENIMSAPVDLLKTPRQEAYDEGMRLLRTVGLVKLADRFPCELSGGQKQRVAIARTLAMRPEVILFDEPTSALDPAMVGEVQAVIRDLSKRGMTMLIVTHEMRLAREIATRVFYVDEGGIYEQGTPEEIFDHPKREKTIRFIRDIKVYQRLIDSKDFDFIGYTSGLEDFGRRHQIAPKLLRHAQTVFEELCVETLLAQFPDAFQMDVTVEYLAKEEKLNVLIRYDGVTLNPRFVASELSWKLIENAAESFEHRAADGGGFTNEIFIQIR